MPWLHEMKWPDVAEYLKRKDVALIPIGSTEQHGRHLPLGADSYAAVQLAEDGAKEADVISAPPLWFGWSPHHMVLPGSISIEPSVLDAFLFQEIRSLAAHGFRNFVVINGHRLGNLPWMQIAAERAQRELGVRVCIFDPAYMSKEIVSELGFGPIGHAAEIETSHLLHIRPKLVDMEQAVDYPGEHARPLYHDDPRSTEDTLVTVASTPSRMEKVGKKTGGSTGRPTKARADLGKRLHEHLLQRLLQVIQWMEENPA